ncbi:hypothetical protein [Halobacillus sp. Marseille-P3879]|uniref:hypothetical protein n=1 Tax=Halobacillus sp. Marseille-P3879 TaxID=2045014 RepID=UPI000C79C304|nr:hypothetical protein [Halobacillus sp. Marseille-P3879]
MENPHQITRRQCKKKKNLVQEVKEMKKSLIQDIMNIEVTYGMVFFAFLFFVFAPVVVFFTN